MSQRQTLNLRQLFSFFLREGMIQFRDKIINKSTVSQALPDASLSCLISQDRALGNYSAETSKVYTRLKQTTTFTSK